MAEYRVSWEIDVTADNAVDAAKQVAQMFFRHFIAEGQCDACTFTVKQHGGEAMEVDLADGVGWRTN